MKTKKSVAMITRETFEKDAFAWLNIVKYHESGSVIQLQDNNQFYIPPILAEKKLLRRILGPYYRKYLLVHINLNESDLYTEIQKALIDICIKRKITEGAALNKMTLATLLFLIEKKGYDIGIFLSQTRKLFEGSTLQQLFSLENTVRQQSNLSVVLFTEFDITNPKFNKLTAYCTSLLTNVIKYPLYNDADAYQFISFNENLWDMKLSDKIKAVIVRRCGGQLWLIRQVMRFLRDQAGGQLENAFNHELLVKKLELIWNKMLEPEREILRKVGSNNITHSDKKTHEYSYLLTIKMIKEVKNKPLLGIPLLHLVLQKEKAANELQIHENNIYINGQLVTNIFSLSEFKFISLLILHKGKIVSRESIAEILWGQLWPEKYSDWAIDRLLYRIRKKLATLNLNKNILTVLKRKGIRFG